jgi:uncharacterized membrane protein YraQ (UPF0718 family)
MDLIYFGTILILAIVIGILLIFLMDEKKQSVELQKEYLKQIKDMTDKVYFRKPEDLVQNKVIETPNPILQDDEEQAIPFEQAPMDEVMEKIFGRKN